MYPCAYFETPEAMLEQAQTAKTEYICRKICPREEVCAGWITPGVFELAGVDREEYARGHVREALSGFRVAVFPERGQLIEYGRTVSYAIRRSEWDEYVARRSGARFLDGTRVDSLDRVAGGWVVNGWLQSPVLLGAGGYFCPVARRLGAVPGRECAVIGEAVEYPLGDEAAVASPVSGEGIGLSIRSGIAAARAILSGCEAGRVGARGSVMDRLPESARAGLARALLTHRQWFSRTMLNRWLLNEGRG